MIILQIEIYLEYYLREDLNILDMGIYELKQGRE